jgi:SAM-dependent methyltransferase
LAGALKRALRPLMRSSLRKRVPPLAFAWTRLGRRAELRFWRDTLAAGDLAGADRERFFTTHVGLARSFYAGKRVLDVGCGPRRELDWAEMAGERVGLDPLTDRYLALLGEKAGQRMRFVKGVAERMPFADSSFDVVSSLNSLDHVQDVDRAASEIKRVLRPGGTLLVLTELNHRPRLTEPQDFSWEVRDLFAPELELVYERRLEDTGRGIDQSVVDAVPYDDSIPLHPGVLVARFEKRSRQRVASRSSTALSKTSRL